jgi:sulfur-carrier protein adenylyltransferase/sulfurtransferase
MWWIKDPDRLKHEVCAVDTLREQAPWLSVAAPRVSKDLSFAIDFDIVVASESLPFRLQYPTFFPETPPSVTPRDGRQLSDHQYGVGGELCLEFRPDNWDPSVTGSMLIESTHRLLSIERPTPDERAIVPSAHSISLGQDLRPWNFRFLLTRAAMEYIAGLPIGSCNDATITDMMVPQEKFTAYIKALGPALAPDWRETQIPDRGGVDTQGVLIRVASLVDFPISPEQELLDGLIVSGRRPDAAPLNTNIDKCRFTIIADARTATMFYSFPKEGGGWNVFPYHSVDLTKDVEERLPATYSVLTKKKVGVVGCGALGSKIAASLARSGVRAFVLIDDDIFKPGNLVRHDLDAGSLGAHKAEALAARLEAITAGVVVSARRVLLGGQEPSGGTASVLDELATCDLLIDATADPQAFNFVASVATNRLRPMVCAEVYAGGIGGYVGRLRPGFEPPPHSARRQYLAWCRDQGVPWLGQDREYGARGIAADTLVADDSDVSVIAAHATRIAVDLLVRPDDTAFPHSAYVIGLAQEWIFTEPFDTRPIDFAPDGEWTSQLSSERTEEAIAFMSSLLKLDEHEDRTDG